MVYAGFRNTWRRVFQTHLLRSRHPIRTKKKTWMPDLTRRRWSKPPTNSCSCWRSKRRRASRTWPPGLTVTVAQACTRVQSLHVCGRGYGGWISPSTGQRSGRYVHPVRVAPVPTHSGPKVTNQGYPGLSENCSIRQYERCFFAVCWQGSVSKLYSYC